MRYKLHLQLSSEGVAISQGLKSTKLWFTWAIALDKPICPMAIRCSLTVLSCFKEFSIEILKDELQDSALQQLLNDKTKT